jgi:hypothetical protein
MLDWSRASLDNVGVRAKRGRANRPEPHGPRQARKQVPPAGRPQRPSPWPWRSRRPTPMTRSGWGRVPRWQPPVAGARGRRLALGPWGWLGRSARWSTTGAARLWRHHAPPGGHGARLGTRTMRPIRWHIHISRRSERSWLPRRSSTAASAITIAAASTGSATSTRSSSAPAAMSPTAATRRPPGGWCHRPAKSRRPARSGSV